MNKRILVTVMVFTLGFAQGTMASIDGFIEDMFLYTSTNPQIVQAQGRGVVVGGHLAIRTPIRSINLITASRPRLEIGGCGGLDIWGGSFSMIDSDEAVELLRQIGANALLYAFQLAIKNISGMIGDVLESLLEMIQEFNRHFRNTCELGRMFGEAMTGDYDGLKSWSQGIAQSMCVTRGEGSDQASCAQETEGDRDAHAREIVDTPAKGNLVWMALNDSDQSIDFSRLFGSSISERRARELIMSLTGTYIYCPDNPDVPPETIDWGEEGNLDWYPTVRLKDFLQLTNNIYLSTSDGEEQSDETPTGTYVYRCNNVGMGTDLTRQCCSPSRVEIQGIQGFRDIAMDLLHTLDVVMISGDVASLESEDMARFINSTSVPVMYLMNRYRNHPAVRAQVMQVMADIIGREYLIRFADELVRIGMNMFDGADHPVPPSIDKHVRNLLEDHRAIGALEDLTLGNLVQLMNYVDHIDRSILRSTVDPRWMPR